VASLTGTVLADRARVIRKVADGPRVEGRMALLDTTGDWFAARLIPAPSVEIEDERHGRRRIVETGSLVCANADLLTSDELEVQSRTLGDARWRIAGAPQIHRNRRARNAVVVPVERLVEPPATEEVNPP